jgi:hypothetical protein
LQDLEVGAVDVDLQVVEIGPAALGQQVGNDDGLAGIGKARQLPGVVAELLLGGGVLETFLPDFPRTGRWACLRRC